MSKARRLRVKGGQFHSATSDKPEVAEAKIVGDGTEVNITAGKKQTMRSSR
jgi:hypothetical protein